MKISLITVAYNSAATIADTLASVAAQTHRDLEHIIIDGASRDNTFEVVKRFERPALRWFSEPDRGIYDAMNKGLSRATGDLIGCLNADDAFADEEVLARVAAAAEQQRADAVYGDLVYVRADATDRVLRHWRSGPFDASRLAWGWMPPHPTFYIRRSALASIGEYNATLRIAADYDWMLRALSLPNFRVAYVPHVLVRMRMGGVSNRSLRHVLQKSREDLWALRENKVGGLFTLACKNLRKVPQFFRASFAARR